MLPLRFHIFLAQNEMEGAGIKKMAFSTIESKITTAAVNHGGRL